MLETIITICLIPLALGAVFIAAAMVVGIIKGIKKSFKKN